MTCRMWYKIAVGSNLHTTLFGSLNLTFYVLAVVSVAILLFKPPARHQNASKSLFSIQAHSHSDIQSAQAIKSKTKSTLPGWFFLPDSSSPEEFGSRFWSDKIASCLSFWRNLAWKADPPLNSHGPSHESDTDDKLCKQPASFEDTE